MLENRNNSSEMQQTICFHRMDAYFCVHCEELWKAATFSVMLGNPLKKSNSLQHTIKGLADTGTEEGSKGMLWADLICVWTLALSQYASPV